MASVAAFRRECRSLVTVAWYVEFVGNTLGEPARNLGALFKGYSADRHNGQHICRTDARVRHHDAGAYQ